MFCTFSFCQNTFWGAVRGYSSGGVQNSRCIPVYRRRICISRATLVHASSLSVFCVADHGRTALLTALRVIPPVVGPWLGGQGRVRVEQPSIQHTARCDTLVVVQQYTAWPNFDKWLISYATPYVNSVDI